MIEKESCRVFYIPAGTALSSFFVRGLKERSFFLKQPYDVGRMHVYLPTRFAVQRFFDSYSRQQSGSSIAPYVHTIDDLTKSIPPPADGSPPFFKHGIFPPVHPYERLFALTTIIKKFILNDRISIPLSSASTLAISFSNLIDEAWNFDIFPKSLANSDLEERGFHCQQIHDCFVDIQSALGVFLREINRSDPGYYRTQLINHLSDYWEKYPPDFPVFIAGSVGSIPSTARFIKAVSLFKNGYVIIQGLDKNLDASTWNDLPRQHPQYAIKQLLKHLGVNAENVLPWANISNSPVSNSHGAQSIQNSRLRLASAIMAPAPLTSKWHTQKVALSSFSKNAIQNLSLIEARNPAEEAHAIALAMRESLETPEKKTALVTPDRQLIKRVSAHLRRWNIIIHNNSDCAISETEYGNFFLLVIEMAIDFSKYNLLAVLRHQRCCMQFSKDFHLNMTKLLEKEILRRPEKESPSTIEEFYNIFSELQPELKQKDMDSLDKLSEWIDALKTCFLSLSTCLAEKKCPLIDWVQAHKQTTAKLAQNMHENDIKTRHEEKLLECLSIIEQYAGNYEPLEGWEYYKLIKMILKDEQSYDAMYHPHLMILGCLQARTEAFDCMILAGLVEGDWPRYEPPEYWIGENRRKELGLRIADDYIGLSAHDFIQGFCAPEVILSYSLKKEGKPIQPSRWILRLKTLLESVPVQPDDADLFTQIIDRGLKWKNIAKILKSRDKSDTHGLMSTKRPYPCPPVESRPITFSISEIKTLICDPYSIYAKKILRLKPWKSLDNLADAQIRGIIVHNIMEKYNKFILDKQLDNPKTSEKERRAKFNLVLQKKLEKNRIYPFVTTSLFNKSKEIEDFIIAHDNKFSSEGNIKGIEIKGLIELELPFSKKKITLNTRADRIDKRSSGYALYDYKTKSTNISSSDMASYEIQLMLEAIIAEYGGFSDCESMPVCEIAYVYIRIGERAGCFYDSVLTISMGNENDTLIKNERDNLLEFLDNYYTSSETGFLSHTGRMTNYTGDYDHLARVKEWLI